MDANKAPFSSTQKITSLLSNQFDVTSCKYNVSLSPFSYLSGWSSFSIMKICYASYFEYGISFLILLPFSLPFLLLVSISESLRTQMTRNLSRETVMLNISGKWKTRSDGVKSWVGVKFLCMLPPPLKLVSAGLEVGAFSQIFIEPYARTKTAKNVRRKNKNKQT